MKPLNTYGSHMSTYLPAYLSKLEAQGFYFLSSPRCLHVPWGLRGPSDVSASTMARPQKMIRQTFQVFTLLWDSYLEATYTKRMIGSYNNKSSPSY